jgi:AraC-like DNA-binding protein
MLESPDERPRYREYAPSADLDDVVRCFWRITATRARPTINRICPDGCADVVVTADGGVRAVGTMRTSAVMPLAGRVDVFGVRFHPGAAFRLFHVPLAELTDGTVALGELGWKIDPSLGERIADARGTPARMTLLEGVLRSRLLAVRQRASGTLANTAAWLRQPGASWQLGPLRKNTGLTERTLERHFLDLVGITPKTFHRVMRFRRALRGIYRCPRPSYAVLALEAGYADQAHLIRDFRSFAGLTPAAYAREWDAVGFVQYGTALPAYTPTRTRPGRR